MKAKRRIIILAEGKFGPLESKTANQAIRYIPDEIVGVIDSRNPGRKAEEILGYGGSIPVFNNLKNGLINKPNTLLIGIAPTGGRLPLPWRRVIKDAIKNKLNIISGLHTFISADEEFLKLAEYYNIRLTDLRKVEPEYEVVSKGLWKNRRAKTIITVGTDCNVGKMTVSFELHREFLRRKLKSVFIATGQSGILISGKGIAVDSLIGDYIAGGIEMELEKSIRSGNEFLHVEGQGSLTHQGYSSVTLGLMHGVMPDAMIIVHHPIRHFDDYGLKIDDLNKLIQLHEIILKPFKKSKVVGIAINGVKMNRVEIKNAIKNLERQTGLPAADVLQGGAGKLTDALLNYFKGNE